MKQTHRKSAKKTIQKIIYIYKHMNWRGHAILTGLIAVSLVTAFTITSHNSNTAAEQTALAREAEALYTFKDGSGQPVDIEAMTSAWVSATGIQERYSITDAERWEIASTLTAEAVGEPYAGKIAVAQCILQACEDDQIRPIEALEKYGYSKHRPDPCKEAIEAVQAVFDFGQVATSEPIKYFYAPARVRSSWHESQDYVLTINNHKFFREVAE